ncbi:MAG TPA: cytochrome c, partial [Anaerolineae bacterium]|nr:cytochrome c [Anaerolineae bacterium]
MAHRLRALVVFIPLAALLASAGCYPNPQPPGLSPVPTLPAGQTPAPLIQTPLAQTPTLFIPLGMGEQVPFAPELQTAVVPPAPATVQAQGTAAAVPLAVGAGEVSSAAGATLYIEGCLCHGSQGQGVSAPPLRNSQFVRTAGDQAVYTVVAYGRNNTRMPAWLLGQGGPMTEAQIMSVVAYLHALQGVPALPTATLGPPPATTAPPETAELARPATLASPGQAVSLTGDVARGREAFGPSCAGCHGPVGLQGIGNPGSSEGRVPLLNPIDSDIASSDTGVFATNLDLRIQYGRVPVGPSPDIVMPAFGQANLLTQQQIADLIAYLIHVNTV